MSDMKKISEHGISKKYSITRHTVERKRLLGVIKPISFEGEGNGSRYFYDEEKVVDTLGITPRENE